MNVADGIVAEKGVQPLHGFTDDGGAQMADVQGLRHVGAAVVHHNGLARPGLGNAELGRNAHALQVGLQKAAGELQVDEARHNGLHHAVVPSVQLLCHGLGNLDGGALILLGSGQSAVALVFAQVRPVGNGDPAKGTVVARLFKGRLHFLGDNIQNLFHEKFLLSPFSARPAS